MNRWWIYQKERFPLAQHVPLVLAFSLSALFFSRLLRGESTLPDWSQVIVGFCTALLLFLQLRIADEFKDFDEDSRYRPYRAVPRGLVRLPELGVIFAAGAVIQFLLAIWLEPRLIVLLVVTWIYLAGMCKEFFMRRWLKAHPLIYLWSHMLIMPLIDLYVTSCDWLASGQTQPPKGILWFLVVSFFNGVLFEFGRKIRAREDEETGVQTYTALWGIQKATGAWMLTLLMNFFAVTMAARQTGSLMFTVPLLLAFLAVAINVGQRFLKTPTRARSKAIETVSGIWTLAMYITLGPLALIYHALV